MTKYDLNRLKGHSVPAAGELAKRSAIAAAVRAFEAADGSEQQGESALAPSNTKGSIIDFVRRHHRPMMSLAASVAALAVAVPLTLHLLRPDVSAPPVFAPQVRTAEVPPVPPVAPDRTANRENTIQLPPGIMAQAPVVVLLPPAQLEDMRRQANARLAEAERAKTANLAQPRSADAPVQQTAEPGRERFDAVASNPMKSVASEPVSTFSVDVDTASYAFVRRALNQGRLPPKDAVRIEELINYFPYSYPLPENRTTPFQPTVTVMPSPWNPVNKLLHVSIKGYDIVRSERPRANLVLLIDTSGSMGPEDRLPLLRNAFRMLVDGLSPDDSVGIVTYAGVTNIALEPTRVADKQKILQAIDKLQAGGSTAGAAGIQEAYRMAQAAFDKDAVNRIILATDGDFNVGITNQSELKGFIERKRETGIYLSVLGVGRDNYNDALMQALAQNGNGVASYIDTLNEARKVLVDEASSTLFPIAKDVKIQIEFNPARVSEYRLIGYETRMLRREDFGNDKVDAGDIGAGHAVTAIYEITPVGSPRSIEGLRYGTPGVADTAGSTRNKDGEYAFLRLRYKLPKEDTSRLIELPVTDAAERRSVELASSEVRFATAVAAFGQLLKGGPYLGTFGFDAVIELANGAKGDDPFGYRAEFVNLVRLAKTTQP